MFHVLLEQRRRFLSGIISIILLIAPFGIGKGANTNSTADKKTIEVGANAAYHTIEEARDYIRTLDKTKCGGIDVVMEAGDYLITKPIVFTAEDSGTETCPIRYLGKDGANIIGGVVLTANDFSKTESTLSAYFPSDVKDQIVTVDLKAHGISAETIRTAMDSHNYLTRIPFLSADGERQIIAQYPNDWMHIKEVVTHSEDGTFRTAVDLETLQTVEFPEEYAPTVQSWSEVVPAYIRARFTKLWCTDDSRVTKIHKDEPKVDVLFGGGYGYEEGTIMYFYNVPEALDIPGEYIIDADAILYYYPTETFETATFTLPLSDNLVELTNADYITFENINFTSSNKDGLILNGNHLSLLDCAVSSIVLNGIRMTGDGNRIENCAVFNIGRTGIEAIAGDVKTISGEGCEIVNNDIYEVSVTDAYGYSISAQGAYITIAHNDCHDSNFKAINLTDSVNCVVEYNDVWSMMLLADDVGALSADGYKNANIVFRYNYVHDIGPVGEAAKIRDYNKDYEYYGADAFYYDNGCSYIETYGNVVKGCSTGYLSNGGRGNSCHNNVFIDCNQWYVHFSSYVYTQCLNPDGTLMNRGTWFDDYVYSNKWKEINPDIQTLVLNTSKTTPSDPNFWLAPVGNTCHDNFIVYNKSNRYITNWGIKPFYIEPVVTQFCPDLTEGTLNNIESDHVMIYTSSRGDLDMEDLISVKAADYLGLTWEEFNTIGRIEK